MGEIWAFIKSAGKVGEALAIWADPKRREVVKLRLAVEAAEHLLQIWRQEGVYKDMEKIRMEKWRMHWIKRFRAFKDGI